jgi:serine carboxypeptidase-like clade I
MMQKGRLSLALFSVALFSSSAASAWTPPSPPTPMKTLPGWDGPLPSAWYSGYLSGGQAPSGGTAELLYHYVIVEAEVPDPSKAPLVVWYQGGPGASSLFGLFVEFGPLKLNQASLETEAFKKTGIPTPLANPYAWSKFANFMIVDNPPPVGFSYCNPPGPSGGGTSCGAWNDTLVATAAVTFWRNFFEANPKYKGRDFYVTGESYAGVYVPIIFDALVENRVSIPDMNLKGFAVGDGCMGTDVLCSGGDNLGVGPYYLLEFLYGHSQIDPVLHNEIRQECPVEHLKSGKNLSPKCWQMINETNKQVGGYYPYALYDQCNIPTPYEAVQHSHNKRSLAIPSKEAGVGAHITIDRMGYYCIGEAYVYYLNRTDVRDAFKVPKDIVFFNGDDGRGFVYHSTNRDVRDIYVRALNKGYRAIFYNGDTDPAINAFATMDLLLPFLTQNGVKQTKPWTPYTFNGKQDVAGYFMEYGHRFNYVTLRGTGHMTGAFNPQAAFTFMNSWVAEQPFPAFVPKTAGGKA